MSHSGLSMSTEDYKGGQPKKTSPRRESTEESMSPMSHGQAEGSMMNAIHRCSET